LTSLQQKEEEMRQKFVIRVREKEGELKEAEREVNSLIFKEEIPCFRT
jgi:septin 6/8/11